MNRADWAVAGLVGAVAAVFFAVTTVPFTFPGESAQLLALVRGLDVADGSPYPVTRLLARLLGGGNALAPVCGAVSAALVGALAASLARTVCAGLAARLAGLAAAALFALSPAVRSAATHLEPRLLGLALALAAVALFGVARRLRGGFAPFASLVGGALWGVGAADQPLLWWLAPLLPVAYLSRRRQEGDGRRDETLAAVFLLGAVVALSAVLRAQGLPLLSTVAGMLDGAMSVFGLENWALVFAVAPLPFALALVFGRRAPDAAPGTSRLLLSLGVSFLAVLALASPVSPATLMAPYGLLPVASAALTAMTAAYLAAFWWRVATRHRRILGFCALGVFALAAAAALEQGIVSYDGRRGAFADSAANVVLDELGARTWLVTDGALDGNLRLAAAARGQELNLVSLGRRGDGSYRARLAARVRETGLGGARNCEFLSALSLGVVPFAWELFGEKGATVSDTARQRLETLGVEGARHFATSDLAGYFGLAGDAGLLRKAPEDPALREARAKACKEHLDRGQALMAKGGESLREARDAFFIAAQICPSASVIWERVIGLDMALGDEKAAETHARTALGCDRRLAIANYVMGSLALGRGELDVAEGFLRRAVNVERPVAAAANDLAEVLLRTDRCGEAVRFARQAMALAPTLAVACETAAEAILASGGDRDEAARLRARARELAAGRGDGAARPASESGN